ncbi:RdgB/HAM1 family non-canonical purine NTP pyrophosphatase [Algiphilus aromaticivorans]|uniref:RdgB/HAM1 family non-canonical purine NTP pyrophosphatase n=1 Tax=Algiphilus aromaticivorans TaxID=382454 RepID=UPI0005C2628F|nr:RdgB/HAM1 family non-canonical purine NTP pyrophosphatase [Algiphilus aromaticivorans]
MKPVVLASRNAGKLKELADLLAPLDWQPRLLSEFSDGAAEETAPSFVENALAKARFAAAASGLPALADDSGLEVAALGGAPGVRSARYAGDAADDAANNAKLLAALAGRPEAERGARFVCVVAFLRHPEDPVPVIAQGFWEGRILEAPQGEGGFGYDPLFFVPERGCSAAELSAADKGQLSHRGRALRALAELMPREVGEG